MTVEEMIAERTVKVTAALDEANDTISLKGGIPSADLHGLSAAIDSIPTISVIPLTASENGTYTAPDGVAYSPVTVNVQGGGGESHTVELTSDGSTIAAATDVFAADVPQTGTYFYILSRPASGHPFLPTTSARMIGALFVNGELKGGSAYRIASNGIISTYPSASIGYTYAGDVFTRFGVG